MKALCVFSVLICVAALGAWQSAAAEGPSAASSGDATTRPAVRLLSSFEPEELLRLAGKGCQIQPSDNLFNVVPPAEPVSKEVKEKYAGRPSAFEPITGTLVADAKGQPLFRLSKAHATAGEYSLVNRAYQCQPGTREDRAGVLSPYNRLFGMDWVKAFLKSPDWSGYDYLWLDVTAPEADATPWLFIEDSHTFGPYVRFVVPKGKTVTISMPLAAAVDWSKQHGEGDLNLAEVRSLYYFDEAGLRSLTYVDNLRLATKAAPRPAALVEPAEYIGADMGELDVVRKTPPLAKRNFPRETGPVEPLGPVTLPPVDWGREAAGSGAFGEGGDYGTANLRGVAAYDNRRIAVVLGAAWIFATFDGGKTWGGLDGKSANPTPCPRTNGHGGMGAGAQSGDLYLLGRHMCNGGGGVTRLTVAAVRFHGDRWDSGPTLHFDHHCRHCPAGYPILFETASGRAWAVWDSGQLGPNHPLYARYSDDGGITWRSPGAWPDQAVRVCGQIAVPWRDQVAVFGSDWLYYGDSPRFRWQFFNGEKFQDGAPGLPAISADRRGDVVESAAGTPKGTLMAACLPFRGKRDRLTVANLVGGQWKLDVLDNGSAGEIGPVALTAGGEKVFCFWVRKETKEGKDTYPLLYALWSPASGWGKPLEVTRETEAVHRIVVPVVSPPDYAPVFWDKRTAWGDSKVWKEKYPWVRFARVPSDKPWMSPPR